MTRSAPKASLNSSATLGSHRAGMDVDTHDWTRLALEYLDQGVTVFDQNLRLVACNHRAKELLGFPDDLLKPGTSLEDMFRFNAQREEYGQGDIEKLVAERVQLAQTFQPHVFERARPDGTVIEVRGNPLPDNVGFVTTYSDITERKHAEILLEQRVAKRTHALRVESEAHQKTAETLRQNDQWIRQITDAVPVLIAYLDADLKYRFANKMHMRWFRLNPNRLLNTNIFDLVESHNRAQMRRDIDAVLKGEITSSEYTIHRRGNHALEVAITCVPHKNDQGDILGFFFLGQDLTEHKSTQRQLVESHKMQALGQMTGGIAHDFNNLLTIILGNLSLLKLPDVDEAEILEIGQTCRQAARRGSELIQRLLSFSRRQSLNPAPTDVNTLITDTLVLLQRTLGEQIQIETELDPQVPLALIDPNQLETCIFNLVLNARDAMPKGGTLTLATAAKSSAQGHQLLLRVTDQGTGMRKDVIDRAFEPFFSTKAKGAGTGLGLSMVYGFVKQSGGQIDIHSKVQRGTTIVMLLPASATTEVNAAPAVQPDIHASTNTSQVLLVEDDTEVRNFVERALIQSGYQVTTANDGDSALPLLDQKQEFDLVITDIVMPGHTDGIALMEHVRQHHSHTRVLCMTGYSEHIEAKLDPTLLLRKPFSTRDLALKVSHLLDTRG